ncbi:MAG: flagellar hook-associated protein FlgK [Pseudomonadota bacterium]|jgi:flagellar hook-associated protein 1 FlgK
MLTNAFDTATAGLQATQLAISVASQNIANAGAAGYVKRSLTTLPAGPGNAGVAVGMVNRIFEDAALTQLRLETSRAAASGVKAEILSQVDRLYGKPGDSTALDGRLTAFTQALQGLASNPASAAVRGTVLNTAAILADQIRGIAGRVQELRSNLEGRLAADVFAANGLLSSIARLNLKATAATDDTARAGILDQRDQQISQLSSYLDVRPIMQRDGTATLMTTSGVVLVERGAATTLSFDGRGALGPASAFSSDPAKRGVGTITATLPGGGTVDLGGRDAVRAGSIAAALELRDTILPQSQRRLDDLAGGLAQALTDKSVAAAPNGGGFDLGLAELSRIKPGNTVTLTVDAGGSVRSVVLVASTLAPRAVDAGQAVDGNARAQTFTIPAAPATAQDFATALSSALAAVAPGLTATASAGAVTLSGAGLQGATATITQPRTAGDASGGYPRLALFVDGAGNTLITGSLDGAPQRVGLAQRLAVNTALPLDSSPLAALGPTPTGPGPARPQFLYDALTSAKQAFSSASGLGGGQAPYSTTVVGFLQDMVAAEGSAAAAARTMDERQSVALGTAQGWFAKGAGVNVDEEMSHLVALQTAYAANARLLTVVREMLDTLLKA